jgi:hypothetical protein
MSNDEYEKKIDDPKKRPNLIESGSWDRDYPVERKLWKNNKVKFTTVKQFKTQTIWYKNKMKENN